MANEVTITVVGHDRTGTLFSGVAAKANAAFSQVRQSLRSHLDGTAKDADEAGKSIGSRLMSSVGSAVSAGAGAIRDALSTGFEMASKSAGPVLIGVLGGVLAAAGPTLGAALGGAITLGLGAGFVGIGAMLLLQNEKIRAEFAKTGNEIKAIMTDAAKPLLPVFQEAWSGVKRLVQEFNPIFKQAFQDAQGPLKEFTSQLLGAFRELKPAVQPIMDAFTGLLGQIGPQLKGVFKDIASSLTDLSRVVLDNKTTIATLFVGLLQAIPAVISGISGLVSLFGTMLGVVNNVNVVLTRVFVGATTAVLGFAERLLTVLRSVGEALGNVPGMEDLSRKLVAGIDQAIGKVQEWKRAAQEAGKAVELKANIFDLTQKLDQAKAALADPNLTKERRAELNADIAKLQVAKAKAVAELGDPKLTKEYRSSITTEIAELQSRLATAKKELQNPELTKERKSRLNAEISQLQAQVATAKAALASIPNKTVTVTVRTVGDTSIYRAGNAQASTRARGGIIGAAGGGPRSNMTLVGEQGPELVRLPFGSTVIPNGQSERMLQQGGSGGGVTVNLYVQGSIRSDRELISLVRDEILNGGFRGALANA
ncbi:hypothetical protein GCM10009850_047700 [Nonomuraea monospora]|uniref:Uncharacterized protein n=1 Tax=Nonomuraea monospora TaxID=568818 RepID=A0ABN3CIN1_9ACTN